MSLVIVLVAHTKWTPKLRKKNWSKQKLSMMALSKLISTFFNEYHSFIFTFQASFLASVYDSQFIALSSAVDVAEFPSIIEICT